MPTLAGSLTKSTSQPLLDRLLNRLVSWSPLRFWTYVVLATLIAMEIVSWITSQWPAPGSEDTELGVLMELEVGHGETEVYAGVQA
jgi:hypothetical protein